MIPYLEFVLSQVPKSGPGAPKLVQLQAVRDLVLFATQMVVYVLKGHDLSRAVIGGIARADTLQNRPGRWFTGIDPFAKACRREACLGL